MNKSLDEDALNDAAWEYVDAFNEIIGEHMSGHHWNNCKGLLRKSILKYLEKADKHEH